MVGVKLQSSSGWYKNKEAIVYVLSTAGHGMRAEQIVREVNERKLYTRWDNAPVDRKMVYAVVVSYPDTFVQAEGQIMLII